MILKCRQLEDAFDPSGVHVLRVVEMTKRLGAVATVRFTHSRKL